MNQSMSSNLNSTEWSEEITVLGRGIPHHSRRYSCLAYCVAGISEINGWLRLYPILFRDEATRVANFEVIKVKIQKHNPEKIRPETRYIRLHPPIKKIDHVADDDVRIKILKKYLDRGDFLHDESWNGTKTLGLIQPIYPEFNIDRNKIVVRYKCNSPICNGHTGEIPHHTMVEYKIQERIHTCPEILEKELLLLERQVLLQRQQLWFVMGTHRTHPNRWLIIEVHTTKM